MRTLRELQEKIRFGIHHLDFSRAPDALYEPILYTLGLGGKRLRPALCLLACDMFSADIEQALEPALGIEIFHNFTLLHDDIMDKAPIRRGKPSVYKKWNTNVAILSGDTMMALAYEYLMKSPKDVLFEVFRVFNQTAIEVCEGQQYDMDFENEEEVKLTEYLEMIRLKTAVLLAGSLKIGAIIGGANQQDADKLYRFGENIGIAFQLKDDLLDVFSDVKKFGKATGGDILEHKKTFLYLKAKEITNPEQALHLEKTFHDVSLSDEDRIARVTAIYNDLNIRKHTEVEMDAYYALAMEALDELLIPNNRKQELIGFARSLKAREY